MQIIRRRDVAIVRARESVAAGIVLLAQTVLRIEQRAETLLDVIFSLEVHEKVSRDILKLVSDYITAVAELLQSLDVIILSYYVTVSGSEGWSIGRRIKDSHTGPEIMRLLSYHQAELASSDDRDFRSSVFCHCFADD